MVRRKRAAKNGPRKTATRRTRAPRLVILADNLYEDAELWYPQIYFEAKGWHVHVASAEQFQLTGKHGYTLMPDLIYDELRLKDWDAMLIPGGFSPDYVRRHPDAIAFVKRMNEKERVIAAICHAAWVLISAGIIKGHRVTTTRAIYDDVVNAGAKLIKDKPVVADKNIITSRGPSDLPFFCDAIEHLVIEQLDL